MRPDCSWQIISSDKFCLSWWFWRLRFRYAMQADAAIAPQEKEGFFLLTFHAPTLGRFSRLLPGSPSREDVCAVGGPCPAFRERPPWIGGDLQTLRNSLCGTPLDLPGGERLLLKVSGGDQLAARLDRPAGGASRPLIVLIHGCTGSEASGTVIATMRHLTGLGWPVLRLNLRGSQPSRPTACGHYHAGRTSDLADALRALPASLVRLGIILVGQSLGGNLVLKFMGEGAHGLPVLGAVSVSAPIDLAVTCAKMLTRRNFAYHQAMLSAMKREALAPGAAVSSAERAAVTAARNVYEYDDHFIAPRFGYRDAQEYYQSNAAKNFIPAITLPSLILHALDDPWIPGACYTAIDWQRLPAIEAVLPPRGGHLGFHGRGSRIPWHDRVIGWWLARKFGLGAV